MAAVLPLPVGAPAPMKDDLRDTTTPVRDAGALGNQIAEDQALAVLSVSGSAVAYLGTLGAGQNADRDVGGFDITSKYRGEQLYFLDS